jgi:hypothetical protein
MEFRQIGVNAIVDGDSLDAALNKWEQLRARGRLHQYTEIFVSVLRVDGQRANVTIEYVCLDHKGGYNKVWLRWAAGPEVRFFPIERLVKNNSWLSPVMYYAINDPDGSITLSPGKPFPVPRR